MSEEKFLQAYKKKIIKECVKLIMKECKIIKREKSDENNITIDELNNILLPSKIIKRCIGCTNSTPIRQCSKNALNNYNYCNSHLSNVTFNTSETVVNYEIVSVDSVSVASDSINCNVENLKKKFIDDTFYYIDEKFIYNISNLDKVGYINSNVDGNCNFILTSDPFILDLM